MLFTMTTICFAEEYVTTPVEHVEETQQVEAETSTEKTEGTETTDEKQNVEVPDYAEGVIEGDVTTNVVANKIQKKLDDVVGIVKMVAQPISYVLFAVGAIMMVVGAFGKKDGIQRGAIACILAIIMYALCIYGEPIISAVTTWLAS